jgi:outer membrane receptor protein involved in Fe transport
MNHCRQGSGFRSVRWARLPLAAAIGLAIATPALAQNTEPSVGTAPGQAKAASTAAPATKPGAGRAQTLEAVVVTAQKRSENLQKVPISINVLGMDQLQQLHVQDFKDYVGYLPGVSFQSGGGGVQAGPGFAAIYMRGVTDGSNRNHSGSQPTVGVYLDDQPVTTIQGPVDIHMYDIARVEVLKGPQGTLYGASAEAGALRIITNKPDPSGFAANYTLSANSVQHGGIGDTFEGMVNIPFNERAAIRLVAWREHDAGYIDNKPGTVTFPTSGITLSNADNCTPAPKFECSPSRARDDYNDVTTKGGRAALKIDLNDNWSISPTVMGQQTIAHGNFASDPVVGKLALSHFYPEGTNDRWWQAALTIKGKIGNFDLTYTGAHLRRNQSDDSDYTDYGFWYDTVAQYGQYFTDNSGAFINPAQHIHSRDGYYFTTHELHVASPADDRLRFVAGVFTQNQKHDIFQRYYVDGLADALSVPGFPNTVWLTRELRYDSSKAVFGEVSYDIIPEQLTATVGTRYYRTRDHLSGFYGFGPGFSSSTGVAACTSPTPFLGAPCTVFDEGTRSSGPLHKFNLTWNITPTMMVYATRSKGFRPGGVNRVGGAAPYQPDFLTNLELGWKTSWLGNRLTFNGAVFRENWENFQYNVLVPPGLTFIRNVNSAQIKGLDSDLNWQATANLHLSAGAAFYNAKLSANYCGFTDANGNPVTNCPAGSVDPDGNVVDGPQAPKGTRLPITPHFKGNLTARYAFSLAGNEAYVQAAWVHVGQRTTDLRLVERNLLGDLPSYNNVDLSAGIQRDNWTLDVFVKNAFDTRGALYKYSECKAATCAAHGFSALYPDGQVYTGFTQPRTIGIRFSQNF